jgi:DNA recombination protein RmuC
MNAFFLLAAGCLLGFLIAFLAYRSRSQVFENHLRGLERDLAVVREEVKSAREENAKLREHAASLETALKMERSAQEEKLAVVTQAKQEFREAFGTLAADALRNNNSSFLEQAKSALGKFQSDAQGDLELRKQAVEHLVKPIHEKLGDFDRQVRLLEETRSLAYGELKQQVASLIGTQENLRSETGKLVKALRAPAVRGRWGEIQLRRVVEMAGMLSHCDFMEQPTITTDDKRFRPDLIVNLPGGKTVVVDVKTPLQAYFDAVESPTEETRLANLDLHARQVRSHIEKLSSKAYWAELENTPEFVVMFLPGESFFSAALEHDAGLIEEGVSKQVIVASPTTLIALLKAVAYGWDQEKIARNAQQISALGRDLHDRLRTLASHFEAVGKGLDRAVEAYNKAVGSLEGRVMVSARRFSELGAPVTDDIVELEPIDTTARTLQLDWGEEAPDEEIDAGVKRSGGQ